MESEKFQELVLQQLQALTEGQTRLENRLDSLEKKQLKIESRLENEAIDKLKALFDTRMVQNDRFDRLEDKLDDISIDTRYLVARIVQLEKLVK